MLHSFQAGGDGRQLRSASPRTSFADRRRAALAEAQLSECVLNSPALRAWPLSVVCLYDARRRSTTPALDEMRRSHPVIRGEDEQRRLRPGAAPTTLFAQPLDRRRAAPRPTLDHRPAELADMRAFVRGTAPAAASPPTGVDDLVLAANEIVHQQPAPRRRPRAARDVVSTTARWCARCATPGTSPTRWSAGSPRRPTPPSGRGLWLANHLCDLVQMRSSQAGTVVRLFVELADVAFADVADGARPPLTVLRRRARASPTRRPGRPTAAGGACCTGWPRTPTPGTGIGPLAAHGLRVLALDLIGHGRVGQAGRRLPARATSPTRCATFLDALGHAGGDAVRALASAARSRCTSAPGTPSGSSGSCSSRPAGSAARCIRCCAPRRCRSRRPCCGRRLRPRLRRLYARPRLHRALRLTPDNVTNLRRAGRALGTEAGQASFFASLRGVIAPSGQRDRVASRCASSPSACRRCWSGTRATRSSRWRTPQAHAARAEPDSRLVVFPARGHEPHRRSADRFADEVAAFITAS